LVERLTGCAAGVEDNDLCDVGPVLSHKKHVGCCNWSLRDAG
jgi:hypothetical protein